MEFSRQRILESAAIPYSRGLSRPRDWTSSLESPALAGWFFTTNTTCCCCSVIKSRPALQSHGLQLTRLLCSSLSHGVCSNLCPLSQWCCPTISCSVTPFSSCPQSFLAPGYFPLSWLCTSGGQTIGVSASVLPMNIQGWFPLGLTGLISLRSKGLWRVFSNTTTWKHWFFGVQPSLWFNSYISHDYWKNHSFDYSFVSKVMSLLFNMLSRFFFFFFYSFLSKEQSPPGWFINPMTGIFMRKRRGRFRHRDAEKTGNKATWQQRQRLEWCISKPRNVKSCWQPPEAGRQDSLSLKASRKNQPCWHLDLGLPAYRTLRE